MKKIIKPKVDKDGAPIIDFLSYGDYAFTGFKDNPYYMWESKFPNNQPVPIYYEENLTPKVGERYYACNIYGGAVIKCINENDAGDLKYFKFDNCFSTEEEANDVKNILKVLKNMEKYYENKIKENEL